MHCCLMFSFPFLRWVKFYSDCKTSFFHLGGKKVVDGRVRQVIVLYSNNYMGSCLDGLSIGRLRRVAVL